MRLLETKQDLRDLVQDLGELLGVPYIILNKGVLTIPNARETLLATIEVETYPKFETFGFYNLTRDEQLDLRNMLHDVVLPKELKELTIKVDYIISEEVPKEKSLNRTLNTDTVRNMFVNLWKATKGTFLEYTVVNEEIVSYKLTLQRGTQIILDYDKNRHMWVRVGRRENYDFVTQFRDGYYPETSPTVIAKHIREIAIEYIGKE